MRLKTFNFCMSYTFKIILIFKLFHNPILDYVKLMLTFLTLKNWIKKDAKKEVINELPIRFMTCDSTQNLTITFFFFKDLGYFLSTPKSKKSLTNLKENIKCERYVLYEESDQNVSFFRAVHCIGSAWQK